MRKLIVCNIISVDGYFEGPGKNVMALPFDPAFDVYNASLMHAADTVLVGRTTFLQLLGYWPPVAENQEHPDAERQVSRRFRDIKKIVISDNLSHEDTAPWTDTQIIKKADAKEAIEKLKQSPGNDIVIFGSHTMWNDLLVQGLVDELHFMIGPALLGAGTPVFEKEEPVQLELIEATILPNSQLVLHKYKVKK